MTTREADELGADELADQRRRERFNRDSWECPECLEVVALGRGCQRCADARDDREPCERCGQFYGGQACELGECLCDACEGGEPCAFHGYEGDNLSE